MSDPEGTAPVTARVPDEARGERPKRDYTVGEEIANSITHGVGVAFSLVALTLMVVYAWGDTWRLSSGIVFGVSLTLLYAGSTLYHAIPFPKARHVFKIIDHSAIYLLIAGGLCYTLGTVFYVYKKVPYFHMVWHLWVLAGSVCHFLAVLLYVIR